MIHKFTGTDGGARLDQFLAEKLEMSRSQVKRAVDEGRVTVNGQKVKAGYKLQGSDEIAYEEEAPMCWRRRMWHLRCFTKTSIWPASTSPTASWSIPGRAEKKRPWSTG